MAVITLYKIKVDTEGYEDAGNAVSDSTHYKYKKPLYTESFLSLFYIKQIYGDFAVISEAELDIAWLPFKG